MLGGFINLVLTTDTYKDLLTEFGRLELSLLHQKMALKQGHRPVPTTPFREAEGFEIAMRAPAYYVMSTYCPPRVATRT